MVLVGIILGLIIGSLWSLLILAFANSIEKKVDRTLDDICGIADQIDSLLDLMEELVGDEDNE